MSIPSPLSKDSRSRSDCESVTQRVTCWNRLTAALKHRFQFVCFWGAIVLPLAHMTLLAQGLESPRLVATFLGLFAANLLTLYGGHGYNRT